MSGRVFCSLAQILNEKFYRIGLKTGEYHRIFPSFSWGIFDHETRLDQSHVS